MKKKIIVLSLIIASVFFLAACGGGGNAGTALDTSNIQEVETAENKQDIDLKMVDDIGLEITKAELVSESFPDYGTYHTVKFKIKNNTSGKIRDVSISATHYDKNDDILSSGGGFVSSAILEPGQSTYLNYSVGYSTGEEGVKRVSFNEINYTRGEEYTANKDMSTKFAENSFTLKD